ncbi:hypothetical protein EJ07DRAFT_161129 [Lizonia empirigonia]|nr:hypothetical protein EJ07DRAFT_161129 [Lizonia empirigonia]
MSTPWIFTALVCLISACFVASAPTQQTARDSQTNIPDFVLKYAPIFYLHSKETHFPTDLATFLTHTTPRTNFAALPNPANPLTLSNLNQLGADTYLTSMTDITTSPGWLTGSAPNTSGSTPGTNSAMIINTKKDNSIDPFLEFGTHVGDWEHVMLRFGTAGSAPEALWYSQHGNGQAFRYGAVEKDGDGVRPVVYVARGSHANYAIPGTHAHGIPNVDLPGGALEDYADKGRRWDARGSSWVYAFDAESGKFTAYGDAPVAWLGFEGRWGDQEYPKSDRRQVDLFGQKKFVSGPTGPRDKQLNRKDVCPDNGILCILRSVLVPRSVEDA